jgi:hypothetical protein
MNTGVSGRVGPCPHPEIGGQLFLMFAAVVVLSILDPSVGGG